VFVIKLYELTGKPLAAYRRRRRGKQQSQVRFPIEWTEDKVRLVPAHYEEQSDEDTLLEDEAGIEPSETVMNVPRDLVPKVRELIAKRRS
jgi:hypothetical protein